MKANTKRPIAEKRAHTHTYIYIEREREVCMVMSSYSWPLEYWSTLSRLDRVYLICTKDYFYHKHGCSCGVGVGGHA